MIKRKMKFILSVLFLFVFFTKCKNDKEEDEITPDNSFDKAGMLSNIGGQIIIPAYKDFKTSIDSLQYFNNLFVLNSSLINLTNLQTQFIQAYKQFQYVSTFEFGPADAELFRASLNVFPCDTSEINTKITTGSMSLSSVSDVDSKGFPAVDFLLYGAQHDNNDILIKFTTHADAANRKNYLTAIVNELKTKTDIVNTGWKLSAGNYISTFKSSTGSDVGSSIGLLVNQLNFDFELLKNARIGIPLGKRTLGVALPEKVEGFYNQQSVALVLQQLNSIENIYLGRNKQNVDGLGLDDYLVHVNAQHTSGLLNDAIKNKFTSAKNKLALITDPLSQAVINNPTIVDAAYMELQQLVVLLKVDMPSALGVLITYQDNDGD